ncbi:MAG TPA: gamma-glutamyl-gamma-aminobutyrate hydrolase family protein [Candidatus Nanopelagicaceae bacterium]|nr:gamma-glutamyl-gamma-aminobutyrate hydrolase family protein [Candidatus Nanopelagicaceae bacterium]
MNQRAGGSAPLVLVPMHSGYRDDPDREGRLPIQTMNSAYIDALQQSRVTPILIPLGDSLPGNLDWADGLLLPGGVDVDPSRYGAEPHPTSEWDQQLDSLEFQLLDWALQAEVPVLGICRGLQVLNVGLGGTLIQDLPSQWPRGVRHPGQGARDRLTHGLHVGAGSRLAEIFGGSDFQVNSLHHQGIDVLAPGLSVSARADDGLIEGVEAAKGPWIVAVQFHPEELYGDHLFARQLFAAFAAACRGEEARQRSALVAQLALS